MSSSKKKTNDFDTNFEVTYEEDVPFMYQLEPDQSKKESDTIDLNGWNFQNSDSSNRRVGKSSRYNGPDAYEVYDRYEDSDEYSYEDDYDDEDIESSTHRTSKRKVKRSVHPTRLAAPIQKGGKAVYRVSQSLLRNLSVILLLAIIALMAYNFLRGSAPYGDIMNAVSSRTCTQMLAAYLAVAAFFILYELISVLWAMSKVRVRDNFGSHKEDVGRGLFSFIFIYICSYAAFLTNAWIPEIHEILVGVKGALDVFGSLHNALFGLCAAGVVSCLLHKYSLSL